MIAITGATGHLGRATLRHLLKTSPASQLVAVVRSPEKAADLAALGITIRHGNYTDPASLRTAFAGIERLGFVSSSEMNDRTPQHLNVLEAAKAAGVQHIAYTSLLNPTPHSAFSATHSHIDTEEALRASGIPFTLLRNAFYQEMLPLMLGPVLQTGVIALPTGDGRTPFGHRDDMAEALALVLTQPGHANQTYDIAPGQPISFADIAQMLSRITGKPITYANITQAQLAEGLREANVPEFLIPLMQGTFKAIANGEYAHPNDQLERLLGRKPQTVEAYLKTEFGKS